MVVGVSAGEAVNKMILKGADVAFGGVAAVDARRKQLEVDLSGVPVVFQESGGLAVKAL